MLLRQREEEKYSGFSLHPTFQSPPVTAIRLMLLTWEPDVLAQAAITKYHRLGDLKNRHVFLTVLKAGKPQIKVPA